MRADLARAREVLREEGPRTLVRRALGVTVYRRLLFAARDNDREAPRESVAGLEFAELEETSLDAYSVLRPDTPRSEVERRLGAGQRCMTVAMEGEIVSARWFTMADAEVPYLGLSFALRPGVAYVYDVFTAPAARGRRISEAVRHRYERALAAEGAERLLGTVMPGNEAGIGLIRGAGYEPVGSVGVIRAGPARVPVRRIRPGLLGEARRMAVPWAVSPPGG